jgi:hypothetical protein
LLSGSLLVFVALGLGAGDPQLEWSGPDICPGAEVELEPAIMGHLGDAAAPEPVEALLRLRDAGPAGLALELRVESRFGSEQHQLTAIDCDRLVDQAALLIAGVIDPFMMMAPSHPAPSVAERHHRDVAVQRPAQVSHPSDAPTRGEPAVASEVESSDLASFGPLVAVEPGVDRFRSQSQFRSRPPIVGAIGVGATTFAGVFPQVGGGVELEGALERGALRWQNAVSGWFGGRFRASDAEVGADLWAFAFSSSVCGVPAASRVRVPICAVGGVGGMRARAVGTVEPRSSTQPWAWVGAEVSAQILARKDLAIALGLGANAILGRSAWEIRSPDVSYRISPVVGVLRLTLEIRELGAKKPTSSAIKPR